MSLPLVFIMSASWRKADTPRGAQLLANRTHPLKCGFRSKLFARFLREHRSQLVKEIAERSRLLDELDQFISLIEKGTLMLKDPVIVELPAFDVTGLSLVCTDASPIPGLWEKFNQRCCVDSGLHNLPAYYGVCIRIDADSFRYVAGGGTPPDAPMLAGMERITVPPQRYARFTHYGPLSGFSDTLGQIWQNLESRWKLTPTYGPDLELYDARFVDGDPKSEVDIYIPIAH
jgi:predicted transcriptional regulator YdeE